MLLQNPPVLGVYVHTSFLHLRDGEGGQAGGHHPGVRDEDRELQAQGTHPGGRLQGGLGVRGMLGSWGAARMTVPLTPGHTFSCGHEIPYCESLTVHERRTSRCDSVFLLVWFGFGGGHSLVRRGWGTRGHYGAPESQNIYSSLSFEGGPGAMGFSLTSLFSTRTPSPDPG